MSEAVDGKRLTEASYCIWKNDQVHLSAAFTSFFDPDERDD
jgi:hypothetical protein